MSRVKLTISYDGTPFHGWLVQPNGITVQQVMQDAIEAVFSERYDLTGCSRTDSGVHALEFCCHFDNQTNLDCDSIVNALNANLPDSISVLTCEEVAGDFHARYSSKGKKYIYKIYNAKIRNPFYANRALFYPRQIDEKLLDRQAKDFIGTHDFSAFCASKSSVDDKIRTVFDAAVERNGDEVIFSVCADGFLYNMVRIMVGTLLEINEGIINAGEIPDIIESHDRDRAGRTEKACGLYLYKVLY